MRSKLTVCCNWQSIQLFPGKYREGESGNPDRFFSEAKFKVFAFYSPLVQVKGMQESKWEKCIATTCNVSFHWIMELLDFFQNRFSDWHPWANFRRLYWIKCHIILFSPLLLSSGWSGQTWAQYGYFKLTVCAFQVELSWIDWEFVGNILHL